jgi:hypothetical protein
MKEYHSGSTLRQHTLKDLFIPSGLSVLLYLLISLLMLAALNLAAFGVVLTGRAFNSNDITPLTAQLSDFQDRLGTPIVMVFWLFIGAAVYSAIWLVESVFFVAKTEFDETRYFAPGSTLRKRYLKTALASNLFLVLMIILWVVYIAFYLRWLLPVYSSLFHNGLLAMPVSEQLTDIAAAVVGNAFAIYLLLLMRRMLTALWRANRP